MSAVNTGPRGRALAISVFILAFVVVPLSVVAWRGGGTLEMRIQQWNALRQSIQSADPAREAIDDPDADSALIENFLFPVEGRHAAARTRYETWRRNRDWWTTNVHLRSIDEDASGTVATVVHEFEIKLLRDGLELERRRVEHVDTWEKVDRVWYLRADEERVLEVLPPREVGFITP